jgi:tetratricopeptide (TPR) repeat protein
MTANSILGEPDPAPKTTQQFSQLPGSDPAASRNRFRRVLWLVIIVLLPGGALAVWWFQRKPEQIVEPPIPSGIQEVEVAGALERKRAEVLANPKSADAWGEYAMLLIAHLFDREAEVCFTRASQLNPNDPRWPYTLGHIALKKDPPNAEKYLRQAMETTGSGAEYRTTAKLLLAERLLELGDLDQATAIFTQELGPPPGHPRATYGLAMIASARGDDKTATRLWSSLLSNEHARKQANAHLATLAQARGDEEAAKRFESKAAGLPEPSNWPDPMYDVIPTLAVGRRGRERMIFFLEKRKQYYEAIQAWLAELEIERTPKALIGAGINYIRMSNYDLGIAYMREALERDPNSPIATYNLALALFTRAEKVAEKNPGSDEVRKMFQEIIVHAKRTTELKPDHAKGYLFWGLSLKYLGDLEGAVEPFRKGLIAKPESFDLQFALGQVLAQLGKTTEAEIHIKNAQQLDPNDPQPYQELDRLHGKKQ